MLFLLLLLQTAVLTDIVEAGRRTVLRDRQTFELASLRPLVDRADEVTESIPIALLETAAAFAQAPLPLTASAFELDPASATLFARSFALENAQPLLVLTTIVVGLRLLASDMSQARVLLAKQMTLFAMKTLLLPLLPRKPSLEVQPYESSLELP